MSIENIKQLMDGVDIAQLLPDLQTILRYADRIARFALMIGPVVLLFLGLHYLLRAPKEANYTFGYRCYFGMGSVNAWRYTQRLAGILFTGVGLILTLVMFGVTAGFQKLDVMDMLWKAVKCGIWEAAIIALVNIVLQVTVAFYFDGKGHLRRRKKHEPKAKPAETEI